MLTYKAITRMIEKDKGTIKKYGVNRLGVFGSHARGEQNAESDVDILVEFRKDKKTFDNYMGLKFFLEDLFKRKVDLVVVGTIKPDLKTSILKSVKYATAL